MPKGKKIMGCLVSLVVDHLTSNPRTEGSNPATITGIEKIMKKVKKWPVV
jgi:hypothetical protein